MYYFFSFASLLKKFSFASLLENDHDAVRIAPVVENSRFGVCSQTLFQGSRSSDLPEPSAVDDVLLICVCVCVCVCVRVFSFASLLENDHDAEF